MHPPQEGARHTTDPPDPCLGRSFLIDKITKLPSRRFRLRARRPPADFGAAEPRGRPVWAAGELRPKVMGSAKNLRPQPVQPAFSLASGVMEKKRDPANFFTERTLAAYLAVSDRTIRNWIRGGDLPSYKLGASRRIDPADVEDFLARHRRDDA